MEQEAGTLTGAVVGTLLAPLTGGSSLLMAGTGILIGQLGNECSVPSCIKTLKQKIQQAQQNHPQCHHRTVTSIQLFAFPPKTKR